MKLISKDINPGQGKKKIILSWTFFIVLILIIFFLLRAYIAIYSPLNDLGADESFQKIMAKHVIEKGEFSLFTWTAPYGGAVMLMIYLVSIISLIFGYTAISLRLSVLFVALIILIFSYLFFKKHFGKKIAIISLLLLVIPPFIYYQFDLIIGYTFSIICDILIINLFFEIFFNGKKTFWNFFALGILSAINFYLIDSTIVLLFTCILLWFYFDKKFILTKNFWTYVSGLFIGGLPLIYFNLTNNFANIKHLFSETPVHSLVCKLHLFPNLVYCWNTSYADKPKDILFFLTKDLPNYFGNTAFKWIYYIIFLIAFSYILFAFRNALKEFLLRFFKTGKKNLSKEIMIILLVIFYITTYFIRGMGKTRYLFSLYILVPFIIAYFLLNFFSSKKRLYKVLSIIFACLLLLSGIFDNISIFRSDYPTAKTEKVPEIVDFLSQNNIGFVYTDLNLKWEIISVSNEKIIGSCDNMCFCGGPGGVSKYPLFEKMVDESSNYAIIVRDGSTLNRKLRSYLTEKSVLYKKQSISDKIIYYNFSKDTRPKEVMTNCTSNDLVYR
jgi:hypothetical protein